jgi:hypothetical protein
MHRYVRMIFDDHDRWLRDGGNQSIVVVQQANLASFIDKYLAAAVNDGYNGAIGWMLGDQSFGLTAEQTRRLHAVKAQAGVLVTTVERALPPVGEEAAARVADEPPTKGDQQQDDERKIAVGPGGDQDERGRQEDPKGNVGKGKKH